MKIKMQDQETIKEEENVIVENGRIKVVYQEDKHSPKKSRHGHKRAK